MFSYKKIVITGAESTGKTTLAHSLSEYYGVPLVTEFAREYLSDLGRDYRMEDLITIARGQLNLEREIENSVKDLLICDTDLTVIKIWSEHKYGECDPWIINQIHRYRADLYILPDFDIPYEKDALRENPFERHLLFELYENELIEREARYIVVKGDHARRIKQAVSCINNIRSELS